MAQCLWKASGVVPFFLGMRDVIRMYFSVDILKSWMVLVSRNERTVKLWARSMHGVYAKKIAEQ